MYLLKDRLTGEMLEGHLGHLSDPANSWVFWNSERLELSEFDASTAPSGNIRLWTTMRVHA